jgi:hypothetical protein
MKSFELKNFPAVDVKKFIYIGNNIIEPAWTIRPSLVDNILVQEELNWLEQYKLYPCYTAIIMTPALTICKTHVDDKASDAGLKQRRTAINIPIQGWDNSSFQFMSGEENIIETIYTDAVMCWDVTQPHRINNSESKFNRITLSFGFVESVQEIHDKLF